MKRLSFETFHHCRRLPSLVARTVPRLWKHVNIKSSTIFNSDGTFSRTLYDLPVESKD
jgi:hypothetical protein